MLQQAEDVAGGQGLRARGGTLIRVLGRVLLLLGATILEPHLHLEGTEKNRETLKMLECDVAGSL